jgi:hypothetical protein
MVNLSYYPTLRLPTAEELPHSDNTTVDIDPDEIS